MKNVDIVIVTFNRLEKLKKALVSYESQSVCFRNLIIVNNASTDGTYEFIEKWKEYNHAFGVHIIHSKENVGGSGGFYLGEKKALDLNADWVFVADDDAYADKDMIRYFCSYINNNNTNGIAAICASVMNMDGSICYYHRDYFRIVGSIFNKSIKRWHSQQSDYAKNCFEIDVFSYVGVFLNSEHLKKCGLVNPDYFIYFDDSEHSIRLKKNGHILVVPSIKITHEGGAESTNNKVTWRNYYLRRNNAHMLLKHYKLVGLKLVMEQIKMDIRGLYKGQLMNGWWALCRSSIYDALFNRLGKHAIYRPGWELK